jgi:hypothetical protein
MDPNQQTQRDALPASMRYSFSAVDSVPSSLTLRRFDSNNGNNFNPTGASEIRIPVQTDGFLDTKKHYLQFQITNLGTKALNLEGDAACIIQELRIESQGIELERISRYNLLSVHHNANQSTVNDVIKRSVQSGAAALTASAATLFSVAGASLDEAGGTAPTRTVTLPLNLSGFLMNRFGKALPQGISQFEIIIRLEAGATAFKSAAAGTANLYKIENPVLFCPAYNIMDNNIMMTYRSLISQRGVNWLGTTYKTYINSLAATSVTNTGFQINDRSSSLLSFITLIRTTANLTDVLKHSLGSSTLKGITNYRYKIGGTNFPPDQIDINVSGDNLNVGRVYNEQLKSFAEMGYTYSDSLVDVARIVKTSAAGAAAGTSCACSGLCMDLKRFDDDRLALVGINTAMNSSPNTIELSVSGLEAASDMTTYAKVEAEYFMAPDGRLTVAM